MNTVGHQLKLYNRGLRAFSVGAVAVLVILIDPDLRKYIGGTILVVAMAGDIFGIGFFLWLRRRLLKSRY